MCFACGEHSLGLGYGKEEGEKFGDVCIECYWELRETYAQRWESEVGSNSPLENPYEMSEEDLDFQERIRKRKAEADR